jgi:hypothetical protein
VNTWHKKTKNNSYQELNWNGKQNFKKKFQKKGKWLMFKYVNEKKKILYFIKQVNIWKM